MVISDGLVQDVMPLFQALWPRKLGRNVGGEGGEGGVRGIFQ